MNSITSWEMFNKKGFTVPMPPDTFVFWATLVEHMIISSQKRTSVLWCFEDHNICFGSSILDAEIWSHSYGHTVSGQWRIINDGKLTLLRECDTSLFPQTANYPGWLQRKLVHN